MATQHFSICFSAVALVVLVVPTGANGAPANNATSPANAAPAKKTTPPHLRNVAHNKGLAWFKKTVARQATKFPKHYFLEAARPTRAVALTFDGGPDRRQTPRLLALLAKHNIKATFFLVGDRVKRYPKLVAAIHAAGHAIGGHGFTHVNLKKRSMGAAWAEIAKTQKAFQRALGMRPTYYRPPYGAVSDAQVALFGARGIKTINWSVDSFDWDRKRNKPTQITREVLKHAHGGAIILLHSGSWRPNTFRALPALIRGLRKRGHTFETVPKLLGFAGYVGRRHVK